MITVVIMRLHDYILVQTLDGRLKKQDDLP